MQCLLPHAIHHSCSSNNSEQLLQYMYIRFYLVQCTEWRLQASEGIFFHIFSRFATSVYIPPFSVPI